MQVLALYSCKYLHIVVHVNSFLTICASALSISVFKAVTMSMYTGQNMGSNNQTAAYPIVSPSRLERKVLRSMQPVANVDLCVENDEGHLHQYYRLRENMFISVWGLKHFSGVKDNYDASGLTVLARRSNMVIGGVRINISDVQERAPLPLEGPDLNLAKAFPDLNLEDSAYCEISRLAILPEFQGGNMLAEGAKILMRYAHDQGCKYVFNMAPLPLSRIYRRSMLKLGLHWDVRHDIIVPDREEFEGIKMVLSVLDLNQFNADDARVAYKTEVSKVAALAD